MKISRQKLRNLINQVIKEAPFADDLGSIESENEEDASILGSVSVGVVPSDTEEEKDQETKKSLARQRKAARFYASSDAFKTEAEKRYRHLDANIFVLSQIGSFSFKPGTVSNTKRRQYLPYGVQKRVVFNDLNQKSFNFLRQIKPDIDLSKVKETDTIIYYQTDAIGNKRQTYKMTPWMIIHAIVDSTVFQDKLSQLTDINYRDYLSQPLHPDRKVSDVMTTGSSKKKDFTAIAQMGLKYPTDDAIAEMICQEILTTNGLHFNREGFDDAQNRHLDNVKGHIEKIAAWFKEYIKGKLIVVDGHGSEVRI